MKQDKDVPIKRGSLTLTRKELDYQVKRTSGTPADKALEEAFSGDPEWEDFFDSLPSDPRQRRIRLKWAARKLDSKPEMAILREKVNERVVELNPLALDTLEEIMIESKSDKVRADAAIEILRQNVGSPEKREETNTEVKIVFGNDPADMIVNGEIINGEEDN